MTIDVSKAELYYLNACIQEQNRTDSEGNNVNLLTAAGEQVLNGRQAVAYMRIRYVGNGDFERMERQRRVIEQTLTQAQDMNLLDMIKLVDELIPTVKTNLPKSQVIQLLTDVMKQGIPQMIQQQIPQLESAADKMINDIYYLIPNDLITNVEYLHNIIYPDETYEASETVLEINDKLEYDLWNK